MRRTDLSLLRAATWLSTLAPTLALAQLCTGLCLQQVTCPTPGVTTTVSGTVYAPNGQDPLPGVLVYIPNGPVDALPAGATCRRGSTPPSSPLVQAITGVDGKFTVTNMPVGSSIPLVIQAGKWRRQVVIPSVAQCTNTTIASTLTRLPKNRNEGDIPHFAVVTGAGDIQECVLRKIGIDDGEFTASSGAGRVHFFSGAGGPGTSVPGIASETALEASSATLTSYDMVIFPCQNAPYAQTPAAQQNLVDYANAGGRVMATHLEYTWLYNVAPFSGTATWAPGGAFPNPDPQTGYIDSSFPEGQQLSQWLYAVGASTVLGRVSLQNLRHDFTAAIPPSQRWISLNDASLGNVPMQYTFDTPVGTASADQCGRVEYIDYHPVFGSPAGTTFPAECPSSAMVAQEKLYEYMLFNLTNNVPPPLTIDDGRRFARYGQVVNYTVRLANNTDASMNSGAVTSTLSPGLDAANALCLAGGGATCTTSGAGGLPASATVPAHSTAIWVISVPVLANTGDTTVELDVGIPGATPVKDVNTLVIFRDSFDVVNADGTQ